MIAGTMSETEKPSPFEIETAFFVGGSLNMSTLVDDYDDILHSKDLIG